MTSFKEIDNFNTIDFQPKENDTLLNKEDNNYYIYKNSKWQKIEIKGGEVAKMTLVEMNKQIINQLPPLTDKEIKEKIEMLDEWKNNKIKHWLLYGREIDYFTFFIKNIKSTESFGKCVIECLNNMGKIYSIEPTEENNAIEIWVKPKEAEEVTYLYLFNYEDGVDYYGY